ncbi:MAG: phosphoribosyltransferase [Wenzhouxiangella sp.]|jgi:putative phosphoribosyl transferase|nr:phosphoribosyltransferase [Wenzhouxiangella sp.]
MDRQFSDRVEAGRVLAAHLEHLKDRSDLLVLGLPRGGVPVAKEVASALGAPLDVLVVRKLGAPGQPELAIGAIASGGVQVLSRELIEQLHVSASRLATEIEKQLKELDRRERQYRGDRPFPDLEGKTLLVIDDGLATGSTMEAAVRALRQHEPRAIIVAVPVAPSHVSSSLLSAADEFIAVERPQNFMAVGQFYRRFDQTSDEQVRDILAAQTRSGK